MMVLTARGAPSYALKQPRTGTGNWNSKQGAEIPSKEYGLWSFTRNAEALGTDWFHLASRDEPELQQTSRANVYSVNYLQHSILIIKQIIQIACVCVCILLLVFQ
ncbi:hypothetical protein DPMN_156705 [Dreissena polymorpha]|uniref:Uncharacterized protein n=1 Tax=Dreissena polymorpha TaxID=45954 RepID=A0A9D4FR62_DREPO|nr:hypothetical protein DPMN_156705 [Dreissena polymorpha]